MLQVNWVKCGDDGHWCDFQTLTLATIKATGVYMIWHLGNPSRVVRLGQGDIANRLGNHRNDPEVMAYAQLGLRVTWASVPAAQQDGVETYLADRWNPLVGDAFPDCQPIAVNDPW